MLLQETRPAALAPETRPAALSNHAVNKIAGAICAAALERAEEARAVRPPRTFTEAERAAAAETAQSRTLRAALACNDFGAVAALVAEAFDRAGVIAPPDSLPFGLTARAVLQGLAEVHEVNARRELGDDRGPLPAILAALAPPPANDAAPTPPAGGALQGTPAWPVLLPMPLASEDGADDDDDPDDSLLDQPISELMFAMVAYRTEKTVSEIRASMGPGLTRMKRCDRSAKPCEWGPDAEQDALTALRFFVEICGDKTARSIKKKTMRRFKEALQKSPRDNGRGVFANLSIPKAIELAEEIQQRQIAEVRNRHRKGKISEERLPLALAEARMPRISMATINKHLGYVNQVYKWLNDVHDIDTPSRVQGILFKKKTWLRTAAEQRPQYEDDDLRAVLLSPLWTGCKSHGRRSRPGTVVIKDALYWSLPIEACAGLRLEEMAQLWLEDVVEIDGIWCFIVRSGADRNIKTRASARVVPIHPLLIKLGLLNRLAHLRKAGHHRLFPELVRDPCHGRYGTSLSKNLTFYLRAIGLYVPNRVHHSARHTFDTTLQNANVKEVRVSELMGHARQGETSGRYYKGARLTRLKKAIDKIDFKLPLVEREGEWHIAKAK